MWKYESRSLPLLFRKKLLRRDDLNAFKAFQFEKMFVARDNELSLSRHGAGSKLVVVGVGSDDVNRPHGSGKDCRAFSEPFDKLRHGEVKPFQTVGKLRVAQDPLQFSKRVIGET